MPEFLTTPEGRHIAYHRTRGRGPTVVFLGGFKSDMQGSKAVHLQAWAEARGQSFLRFDYSGHGESSGAFLDGAIGDWAEDAHAALEALTEGPLILVGSSMGGWISLLMTRKLSHRIKGLVGIAAAPDFTEDSMWAALGPQERAALASEGQVQLPSDYAPEPYIITRRLIENGRENLVLRSPLPLPFPTRFLQGTADEDVSTQTALRLLDHAEGSDIRLTLLRGADHRFSTPECLQLITDTIESILTA